MNLRSLEYFVVLAEELNFTRAAVRAHIEQAALSQAIRRLEKEIGFKLFNRSTRGVSLTSEGVIFLPTANAALETLATGLREAKSSRLNLSGRLRIGYVASAAFDVLPELLRNFRSRYPNVEFILRQIDSKEQIDLLSRGELDGGLIRPRRLPGNYGIVPIVREPFVCVVPASHRLSKQDEVSISELSGEDFIMLPSDPTSFSHAIASIFEGAGFTPNIVQETQFLTTIVGLVGANLGISIVPLSVRTLDISGVKFLRLKNVKIETGMDFVWQRDTSIPLMRHLVDLVSEQFLSPLNQTPDSETRTPWESPKENSSGQSPINERARTTHRSKTPPAAGKRELALPSK